MNPNLENEAIIFLKILIVNKSVKNSYKNNFEIQNVLEKIILIFIFFL